MYRRKADLSEICIPPDSTLRAAITAIDRNQRGIVLLTDREGTLLGTVSDGDVRRAILDGVGLDTPVVDLLARKDGSPYPEPVTAPVTATRAELLELMRERIVRQVPLIDEEGKVADLVILRDLMPEARLEVQAVIMAGGYGTRLRPLTEELPKPLLPVGERPLMELMVEQLKESGVDKVLITSHYLPEKITDHFGDGSKFGIDLSYVHEDQPLGTAGALALMDPPDYPLLVINGDILTQVDFAAMLEYHQEQKAAMTVALRKFEMDVPYGVVECDGPRVSSIKEKPKHSFFINAGMYLIEPDVLSLIPKNQRFDMTELMDELIKTGRSVVGFPIREYWLDIGEHDAYQKAQEDVKNGRFGK